MGSGGTVPFRSLAIALLAACALLGSTGCASTLGSGGDSGRESVPVNLKLGSADVSPGDRTLRSQEELSAVWEEAGLRAAPPDIDFEQEIVLITARGCLPNSCYSTRIRRFTRSGDTGQAWIVDSDPSPACYCAAVRTCPFHMVRVPRVDGEVSFQHKRERQDCQQRRRP